MIREIAIEPELIIEWSNKEFRREFKPIDIRDEYGLGSPKRMSRYPKGWKRLIGDLIEDFEDGSLRQKRVEELAKAVIEHSIKRKDCIWESDSDWYYNALKEDQRIPFEVIFCRANFEAEGKAVSLEDFRQEHEEKLKLLKLPRGAAPRRNIDELIKVLKPWLRHCKKVIVIDPHFNPNQQRYNEPLVDLINKVLTNCSVDQYPYFEIIRKFDEYSPSLEHLKNGFKDYVCDNIPEDFEIYFSVYKEKYGEEELHQRYILTEVGGVAIDPGFDVQDNPDGNDTYDINLLDKDQYLKRWDQYYTNADTFEFKFDQLIISNEGITS